MKISNFSRVKLASKNRDTSCRQNSAFFSRWGWPFCRFSFSFCLFCPPSSLGRGVLLWERDHIHLFSLIRIFDEYIIHSLETEWDWICNSSYARLLWDVQSWERESQLPLHTPSVWFSTKLLANFELISSVCVGVPLFIWSFFFWNRIYLFVVSRNEKLIKLLMLWLKICFLGFGLARRISKLCNDCGLINTRYFD